MIRLNPPLIGEAEKRAALEVLESGQLAQGPKVEELEQRWAERTGAKQAVAVSSGTAALHLALLAHGVDFDEVITTPLSFVATANAVRMCNHSIPVFVDVEPETGNIDWRLVERATTDRTRAILPVHLYGRPCGLGNLAAIAKAHDLPLVQDACQAVGATFRGRPLGEWGMACYSLYATKNITAGEGGMITTDSEAMANRLRELRNHGTHRFTSTEMGYNYRLTEMQAAIALAQLERLDEFTARRRANAAWLSGHISNPRVVVPADDPGHVWHQYTVRVRRGRNAAIEQLRGAGIQAGVYYPVPLHRMTHVREWVGNVYCPVAERLACEVLSLPVHPGLGEADLEAIVKAVNAL